MIKLYDVIRIKDSGITRIVTNISSAKGRTVYTVENNKRGRTGIPGARNDDSDSFAVFDCMKGELEKVKGYHISGIRDPFILSEEIVFCILFLSYQTVKYQIIYDFVHFRHLLMYLS